MIRMDENITGCVRRGEYGYKVRESVSRLSVLRGRARYRLKDEYAYVEATVTFDLDAGQFSNFQSTWNTVLNRGLEPFELNLTVAGQPLEIVPVRALGQWSATGGNVGRWYVTLQVEVPPWFMLIDTLCDVIYGGPITNLSEDVIWGGLEIDTEGAVIYYDYVTQTYIDGASDQYAPNLAIDIIAPCAEVLST